MKHITANDFDIYLPDKQTKIKLNQEKSGKKSCLKPIIYEVSIINKRAKKKLPDICPEVFICSEKLG